MKKLLGTVGVVAALGAGAFAISTMLPAGAQTSSSSSSTDGAAAAPGACPQGGGRKAAAKDALDALVQQGVINQDQESAVIDALKGAVTSGQGKGRLGKLAGARARIGRGMVQVAADKIGVDAKDLVAARRNGQSVADVATSKGVDPSDVVNAIVDAGTQRIDQAVTKSHLQQARADAMKSKLPDVATKFVNAKGAPGCEPGPMSGAAPGTGSDDSTSSSS